MVKQHEPTLTYMRDSIESGSGGCGRGGGGAKKDTIRREMGNNVIK